jgi:hypothetical protein
MSLRFIFAITCLLPIVALGWILFSDFTVVQNAPAQTNAAMRTRMCREHIALARSAPSNAMAKQAVDECVVAGYITRQDVMID